MAPTSQIQAHGGDSPSNRLPRSYRLKRRRLIEPLFDRQNASTSAVSSGTIRLLYRRAEPLESEARVSFQVGFAVSRTLGGAIVRNKIKRQMRESFRHQLSRLHAVMNDHAGIVTMMILARRLPGDASEIGRDVRTALDKMILAMHSGSLTNNTKTEL